LKKYLFDVIFILEHCFIEMVRKREFFC
jgi:hypothetical protein